MPLLAISGANPILTDSKIFAIYKVTLVPVTQVSSKLFKALLFELSINVANSAKTKKQIIQHYVFKK